MGHRDDLLVTRQYTRMTNAAGGPPTRSVCLLGFVQVGIGPVMGIPGATPRRRVGPRLSAGSCGIFVAMHWRTAAVTLALTCRSSEWETNLGGPKSTRLDSSPLSNSY